MLVSQVDKCLILSKQDSITQKSKIIYCKKALSLLSTRPNDSITRARLFDVIIRFDDLKSPDGIISATRLVFQMAEKSQDTVSIARAYRCFGSYYLSKKNIDSAYYYYTNAKKIYLNRRDYKNLASCCYSIASIQYDIHDLWNSEKSAIEALKYARLSKSADIEFCALMIMGIISSNLEDYPKALEKDFEALRVIEKSNLFGENRKENCLNNIGGVYQSMKSYEKALFFFNEALENKNLHNEFPELYSTLIDNKAYSKFQLGHEEEVEQLFNQSLEIRQEYNFVNKIPFSYMHLSEFKAKLKDTTSAIAYSKKSIQAAKNSNDPKTLLNTLQYHLKISKTNFTAYSQKYIAISDSLQLAERQNRNKFARIAFETEEITTEKDQAIKQKWIILSTAIAIMLLGLLLFIIKMQRAKQKELILVHEQQRSDESIYQLIHDQQIKIDEGRQAEKRRIARELHDGVMNKLTSTRLNLFILNKKKDDETIKKCLTFIDDIQEVEKEIRKVAHDLSDDLFSGNKSFNLLLESLFNEFKAISSTEISPEIDPKINWEITDNIIKMNLYRILQELITNCNKYAYAKHIFITITKESNGIFAHINDDGNGFNMTKSSRGIGLKNIEQRVKLLNGTLTVYSNPGEGTTVSFFLPTVKSV